MKSIYCEACGRVLDESKAVWLELDLRDNSWHREEDHEVPSEFSQGCFPFGRDCFRRKMNRGEV